MVRGAQAVALLDDVERDVYVLAGGGVGRGAYVGVVGKDPSVIHRGACVEDVPAGDAVGVVLVDDGLCDVAVIVALVLLNIVKEVDGVLKAALLDAVPGDLLVLPALGDKNVALVFVCRVVVGAGCGVGVVLTVERHGVLGL